MSHLFFSHKFMLQRYYKERNSIISKNRVRKNDARLCFSDEEMKIISERMEKLGIKNRSGYLRKMALDGYIIQIDTKPIAELVRLIHISSLI